MNKAGKKDTRNSKTPPGRDRKISDRPWDGERGHSEKRVGLRGTVEGRLDFRKENSQLIPWKSHPV